MCVSVHVCVCVCVHVCVCVCVSVCLCRDQALHMCGWDAALDESVLENFFKRQVGCNLHLTCTVPSALATETSFAVFSCFVSAFKSISSLLHFAVSL